MKKIGNKKKQKKNSLLFAITIVVGSVIGTGIFFKNESIIPWAQGNAWLVIGAWIFGAVIALSTALTFSQIAFKAKRVSNTGIGEFTEEIVNPKLGWHTKISWATFYFPWNYSLICLYAADYILRIGNYSTGQYHTFLVLGLSLLIATIILSINILWTHISELAQINMTFFKMIPLFILAIGAVVTFFVFNDHNWWTSGDYSRLGPKAKETANFSLPLLIFFLVPGTLFAFDSFLNATNISEDVSKKNVTYAIIGGICFIAFIYIFVTIAILNTGTLNAEDAIIKFFGGDPNKQHLAPIFNVIKKTMEIFVLISVFGSCNGFAIVWVRTTKAVIKKKKNWVVFASIFGSLFFIGLIGNLATIIIYFVEQNKKDIGIHLIDALSNPLIVISYVIYAITIFFGAIKNWKQTDSDRKYKKWFTITAIISITGIGIVLSYTVFYVLIYQTFMAPWNSIGDVYGWIFLIIVAIYVTQYICGPFIFRKLFPKIYKSKEEFSIK